MHTDATHQLGPCICFFVLLDSEQDAGPNAQQVCSLPHVPPRAECKLFAPIINLSLLTCRKYAIVQPCLSRRARSVRSSRISSHSSRSWCHFGKLDAASTFDFYDVVKLIKPTLHWLSLTLIWGRRALPYVPNSTGRQKHNACAKFSMRNCQRRTEHTCRSEQVHRHQ
jgi:hypothetical protein